MRRLATKIAKFICSIVFITLAYGMCFHPVSSEYFSPGSKYAGPHMVHLSEGDMQFLGAFLGICGLGLMYSALFDSRK
jgi:hypothetical protein